MARARARVYRAAHMKLLPGLLLLAAVGCGVETDERPATTEYITTAILRPSCGNAGCHSSQSQKEGVVLDTIEGVEREGAPKIYAYVASTDPEERMPADAPLPDADIALIATWAGI